MFDKIKELIKEEKKYINDSEKQQNTKMSKIARTMKNFLGCNAKYYPETAEDNDVICGYVDALKRAEDEKFIPVIIDLSSNLLDAVLMNTVIDSDDDSESILDLGIRDVKREEILESGTIDKETFDIIKRYRKNMLSKDFSSGKKLLDEMIENNMEYFGGYELEKDELEVKSDPESEIDNLEFDAEEKNHGEVLIAEIPVEKPWEIFSYIPFGGWNDCPSNENLMAISKYWYEKYNASPFVISHNTLEYIVEKPVKDVDKIRFAEEFYAFCPDRVDKYMEDFNIDKLAKKIYGDRVWYFCWN